MSFFSSLFHRSPSNTSADSKPIEPPGPKRRSGRGNVYQFSASAHSRPNTDYPTIDVEGVYGETEGTAVPAAGANGVWINIIIDESQAILPLIDSTIDRVNKYLSAQKAAEVKDCSPIDVEGALDSVFDVTDNTSRDSSANSIRSYHSSVSSDVSVSLDHELKMPTSPRPASVGTGESSACSVSITKFDSPFIYSVCDRVPLPKAPLLSRDCFHPTHGANLLDAIGAVIQRVDSHLSSHSEVAKRPAVLTIIISTGAEDSSQHFPSQVIQRMVTARQNAGWAFVFIGADPLAASAPLPTESIGFLQANSLSTVESSAKDTIDGLSEATVRYRGLMKLKKDIMKGHPAPVQERMNNAWNAYQTHQQFFHSQSSA